jgi:hypothetical protein
MVDGDGEMGWGRVEMCCRAWNGRHVILGFGFGQTSSFTSPSRCLNNKEIRRRIRESR